MKKYILFIGLFTLSLLWACGDEETVTEPDPEPTSTELIAGEGDNASKTWRIDKLSGTVDLNGLPLVIDLLDPPVGLPFELPIDFNCLTDNEFTFFSNNTFTAIEGQVSCADSLDATATGTWLFTESNTDDPDILTLTSDNTIAIPIAAPLPIASLTESSMVTSFTYVLAEPITVATPISITIEEVDITVTLTHP